MRFVLDHDVDYQCHAALLGLGHQAWSVGEAGRALANDTDQLIYAQQHKAILLTHDKELYTSRRDMPIGRAIRLRCEAWDAPDLLKLRLDQSALAVLKRHQDVFVEFCQDAPTTFAYGTSKKRKNALARQSKRRSP